MASLAASLFLSPPPAQAGTYTLTYAGGQSVGIGVQGGTTRTTTSYKGTYGGSAGALWTTSVINATCTGQITATATWQPAGPGDTPPASVIVQESGTATYGGTGISVPTGSCDDGLQDPEVDAPVYPVPPGAPTSVSGTSTGVHYWVKTNPGTSFPLTPSPSAKVSDQVTPGGNGGVSVSYTVQVYPVIVSLGGTTLDASGNLNILIGQGCKASMSAGPATLSNFQWSASPIFDQFLIASDQSSGYATFLSAAALTQPNPTWHWYLDSGAGSFMVSCSATASINGKVIGTVTGQQQVKVWAPYYYFKHNAGLTGIYGSDLSTGGQSQMPPGMTFVGAVGTPALFVNSGGTGSWLFVQTINTNHYQYYSFSPIPVVSGSQGLALDNVWPYAPGWPADSVAGASTPHSADDSPDLLLISGIDEFIISDTYQMYIMYSPPAVPGFDTQYVPLHCLTWTWDTPDSKNIGGWPAGASGTVGVTSDLRWETHPTWTKKYKDP